MHLSQDAAAKRLGTKQRTWADWEVEKYFPEVDFAEDIERLTGKSVRVTHWARACRAKRAAKRGSSKRHDADDERGPTSAQCVTPAHR